MHLKKTNYSEMAQNIRQNNSRIYVYGAGMIGQIVVPYIVELFRLHDYIECFVDMDKRKSGKMVTIGFFEYEIKTPDVLDGVPDNTVILLTNSKFCSVIDYLDNKESLHDVDCYIIPVMQKQLAVHNSSFTLNYSWGGEIPKIIHYCWFGETELPVFLKECIKSWVEYCPDFEIRRWDETSYDVSKYLYTSQAFAKGKYGFVTDVARLDILYQYGGIYLDTDVKLLRPFDKLMNCKGFVGTERWGNLNSGGGIGAVPHHPMIKEMLDYRLQFSFVNDDGTLNTSTNGIYETTPFVKRGLRIDNTLQIINDMVVLPASVFHPYDYMSCEEKIEDCTIGIHYFYGGWMDEEDRKNRADTQAKYQAVIERIDNEK